WGSPSDRWASRSADRAHRLASRSPGSDENQACDVELLVRPAVQPRYAARARAMEATMKALGRLGLALGIMALGSAALGCGGEAPMGASPKSPAAESGNYG